MNRYRSNSTLPATGSLFDNGFSLNRIAFWFLNTLLLVLNHIAFWPQTLALWSQTLCLCSFVISTTYTSSNPESLTPRQSFCLKLTTILAAVFLVHRGAYPFSRINGFLRSDFGIWILGIWIFGSLAFGFSFKKYSWGYSSSLVLPIEFAR